MPTSSPAWPKISNISHQQFLRATAAVVTAALAIVVLPISPVAAEWDAGATTLRSLTTENPATLAGLEESLLGRKARNLGRRLTNYLALAGLMFHVAQSPTLPVAQAQTAGPATSNVVSAPRLPVTTISPTMLGITLPAALTGQSAGAYLFTDQGYLQGAGPILENGQVAFTITVSPPNRPGWVAAVDRIIAVFPRGVSAPATTLVPRVPGATLVMRIAPNGALSVLVGTWPASPLQVGAHAFGPLRQFLGPQRQIGPIVSGDPAQILTLIRSGTDFFGTMVRAGQDTVWISGLKFSQLSPGARQELVIRAADAGLTTLGFIDGDYSWAFPATWPAVLALYRDLFDALLALDLGPLSVQWVTDIEQQDAARLGDGFPPWDGDMTGVMEITEQIVQGAQQLEQDYRAAHRVTREIVRRPFVLQFGAPWLYNGGRPAFTPSIARNAVVHGIRPLAGAGAAIATFQDTVDGIDMTAQPRVLQESAPFLYVVETSPVTDGRTFYGRVADAGPALLGALQRLAPDRLSLSGGVAWHARNAGEALSGARQILAAPILTVSPDGRSWVRRAPSGGRLQFWFDGSLVTEYALPAAFAKAKLLPQFNGDQYLFLMTQARGEGLAQDGFAVFGFRRPPPGAGLPAWSILRLRDPNGTRITILDRALSPGAEPIAIHEILPNFGPPDNDLKIRYSPIDNSTGIPRLGPSRTEVFVIEPAGLEEDTDEFLREQQGVGRETGRLA